MSALAAEEYVAALSPRELRAHLEVLFDWRTWARPSQLEPAGDWTTWLIMAGRGYGKTRTGAEWIRERVAKGARRIALIGRTSADTRDVMVEGESGLLACFPPSQRPHYEPSKRRVTFRGGALATLYSGDEPELLRGPQHDTLWADEVAAWRYPETWDNALLGLRLGRSPRAVVTTTPKPKAICRILRELIDDATTVVTRGSTHENAENLAPAFMHKVLSRYKGTRLERQEIEGELLEDFPGALWTLAMRIAANAPRALPAMGRTVVSIDPAASAEADSDETGLTVCGKGEDGHGYVLADRSGRMSPEAWGQRAVDSFREYQADLVVAERNNGGDMVASVLRAVDPTVPVKLVWASRGKHVRAEPVSVLYERGLVHHAARFQELEEQLSGFTFEGFVGDASPDRAESVIWALTELFGGSWGFEALPDLGEPEGEGRKPREGDEEDDDGAPPEVDPTRWPEDLGDEDDD